MSRQPTTIKEVFALIRREYLDLDIPIEVSEDWINRKLAEARAKYPFFGGHSYEEFVDYGMSLFAQHVAPVPQGPSKHSPLPVLLTICQNDYYRTRRAPTNKLTVRHFVEPTDTDFWNAAYDFDPLGPNAPYPSVLGDMIRSGRLEPIILGTLKTKNNFTKLKLIPAIGALPATPIPNFTETLDFAVTDASAIIYPDGHPSAETTPLKFSANPKTSLEIQDSEDDKLRRIAAIGWVIQQNSQGAWRKTGHVLVIDMGEKSARDRQPWFVLASEWPTDDQDEAPDRTFTIKAGDKVASGDPAVPGILPGEYNRTPLGLVKPLKGPNMSRPVLKQFGKNFVFEIVRLGGHRAHKASRYGPALVKIREWYWDPKNNEEVCYTDGGLEYMRYKQEIKVYSFPDIFKMNFDGEQGLFGELEDKPTLEVTTGPISLSQRLRQLQVPSTLPFTQRRMITATEFEVFQGNKSSMKVE